MRTTFVSSIVTDPQQRPLPLTYAIDRPQIGNQGHVVAIDIAGWIFGEQTRVLTMEVYYRPVGVDTEMCLAMPLLASLPVTSVRPDVVAHFSSKNVPLHCGFNGSVSLLGMPLHTTLVLAATLEHGERFICAVIDIQRSRLKSTYRPHLQPLMLSAQGRSGTTWMMQLLSTHPDIVAQRRFPYETRIASYWLHLLKITTDPAGSDVEAFLDEWDHIGRNPFGVALDDPPEMREWLQKGYAEEVATFVQRMIDQHYLSVAKSHGYQNPEFFCEKVPMVDRSRLQILMREIYPEAREIFLVRDMRDRLCSVLEFNARRGHVAFGREQVRNDEEYVGYIADEMRSFLADWQQRANQLILIRYEDLAQDTNTTLQRIYAYLELDCDDDLLSRISTDLTVAPEVDQHRTSTSLDASIGRWRRDLSPQLQAACAVAFADLLEAFGYERT
jgi:hypothetical protein